MHKSVLLNECIENLNLKDNSVIVDCTLGYGGHSSLILEKIPNGHLYAFDQDKEAIKSANERLKQINNNYSIINDNFVNIDKYIIDKVDGILFDLGVSSPQLDEEERGFSFHKNARLDMRMNKDQELDAYKVVNEYDENRLRKILEDYGEEKFAYKIAHNIVKKRSDKK